MAAPGYQRLHAAARGLMKGRGGQVLADRGLRRPDGTWPSREELEAFALQEYERFAAGGRARAAKATRDERGRFAVYTAHFSPIMP